MADKKMILVPILKAKSDPVTELKTLGRYTLLEKISEGGMGDVFLAVSAGTSGASGLFKFVALKKVHREIMNKPETKSFFENEGKIGLNLAHSNLVQMYEASADGDEFFFVMEYIDGITLGSLIKKMSKTGAALPTNLLLSILVEFANALAYIHSYVNPALNIHAGIVHQDISAKNVMIDFNGRVKIIDFGIAKPQIYEEKNDLIVGSLGYMSPEQLKRQRVTHRSDIYSFGVTMWELVCGCRLFSGPDAAVIKKKKLSGEVPPLSQYNKNVPKGLQAIVSRCLQLDPLDRYASVADILQDLSQVMNAESGSFQNGQLAEFLDREFRTEKQLNMDKLRKYSQDIMNSKLKIHTPATASTAERNPQATRSFKEMIPVTASGDVPQKRVTLIFEMRCCLSRISVLSENEIIMERDTPKSFWGQRCLMVSKPDDGSKSISGWVYISADGRRLQRSPAVARPAEFTKTELCKTDLSKTEALGVRRLVAS